MRDRDDGPAAATGGADVAVHGGGAAGVGAALGTAFAVSDDEAGAADEHAPRTMQTTSHAPVRACILCTDLTMRRCSLTHSIVADATPEPSWRDTAKVSSSVTPPAAPSAADPARQANSGR